MPKPIIYGFVVNELKDAGRKAGKLRVNFTGDTNTIVIYGINFVFDPKTPASNSTFEISAAPLLFDDFQVTSIEDIGGVLALHGTFRAAGMIPFKQHLMLHVAVSNEVGSAAHPVQVIH